MDARMQSKVEDEARRLVLLVEERTGLRSRWNGQVFVLEDAAMQALRGAAGSGRKALELRYFASRGPRRQPAALADASA